MAKRYKKLFDENGFENIVNEALKDQAEKEMRSLRRTTQTWRKKPKFYTAKTKDGYEVRTDNELWWWINRGTKARTIYPKGYNNGGSDYIQYPGKFTPKTRPGMMTSREGGKYGAINKWPTGMGVPYPGIEARKWDEIILEKAPQRFQDSVLKILDKFLKGS